MRATARSHRVPGGAGVGRQGRANRGASRIKIAILLGIVLVAAAVVIAIKRPFDAVPAGPPEQRSTTLVPLGEFLVNLVDNDNLRFLKAEVTLEIEGTPPAKGGEGGDSEEDPRTARMRDVTVMVLSDASFDDLRASGGKERLKKQLKMAVSEELRDTQVRNVLFTSFVMQ